MTHLMCTSLPHPKRPTKNPTHALSCFPRPPVATASCFPRPKFPNCFPRPRIACWAPSSSSLEEEDDESSSEGGRKCFLVRTIVKYGTNEMFRG